MKIFLGLENEEEDGELLSQSFDINFAQEGPFFRFRTNTESKLDKMSDMRKKQSQIKTVKCDDSIVRLNAEISSLEDDEIFVRKVVTEKSLQQKISKLTDQIENLPPMPINKFRQYSQFDGTSHSAHEIRTIQVFVMPFPKQERNYPVRCCVQATAKVEEFIGFILFKCTQDFPEAAQQANFENVSDYGLFITDETGEPDLDFPALDGSEQVQRFQFAHLALSKRVAAHFQNRAFSVVSDTTIMIHHTTKSSPTENNKQFHSNTLRNDEIAMNVHDKMVEAPIYKAYRLHFITKKHFRTEVQLGISGENLEVDPIKKEQKNAIIFKLVKAIHFSTESIAWCEISGRKSSKFEFKIAHDPMFFDPLSFGASTSFNESTSPTSFQLKIYTFETDPTTAEEIVLKVGNILKIKNSSIYREYPSRSDKVKKSFIRKKKFPI